MIDYIEDNSFAHLTSLEVINGHLAGVWRLKTLKRTFDFYLIQAIDLSINALHSISMDLFQLPRLRNLYHSENSLMGLEHDLKVGRNFRNLFQFIYTYISGQWN